MSVTRGRLERSGGYKTEQFVRVVGPWDAATWSHVQWEDLESIVADMQLAVVIAGLRPADNKVWQAKASEVKAGLDGEVPVIDCLIRVGSPTYCPDCLSPFEELFEERVWHECPNGGVGWIRLKHQGTGTDAQG